LVRAWLEGDWNSSRAAFFPEFGDRHIVDPIELPSHGRAFAPWTGDRPALSVGWYAVLRRRAAAVPSRSFDQVIASGRHGRGPAEYGLKMTATEVGKGIVARQEEGRTYLLFVLDPSAFARWRTRLQKCSPKAGAVFRRPTTARNATRRMGGWDSRCADA